MDSNHLEGYYMTAKTNLEDLYRILADIGFGNYEARAYCALLQQSPANGYNIAKESGVPRAKIYETLEKLLAKGFIVQVESMGAGSRLFAPVDPDSVILDIEERMTGAYSKARNILTQLQKSPNAVEVLWRVASQQDLISRGINLADKACTSLHVALWNEEFDALKQHLFDAVERGVRMALVLYSEHSELLHLQELGAGAILHSRSKRQSVPVLGRQFVLVSDREDCITGSIFSDNIVEGVYTKNRGLVTNAVDLVNHEIYLEHILTATGNVITDIFGTDLEKLDAFDPIKN
jgi:HTH-type transcriptional regulator, sugar sensing transcriptional regulator